MPNNERISEKESPGKFQFYLCRLKKPYSLAELPKGRDKHLYVLYTLPKKPIRNKKTGEWVKWSNWCYKENWDILVNNNPKFQLSPGGGPRLMQINIVKKG